MSEMVPKVGDVIITEDAFDDDGELLDDLTIDEVNGQSPNDSDLWSVSASGDDYTIKWDDEEEGWVLVDASN